MFDFAILYINKMNIQQQQQNEAPCCPCFKQFNQHCSGSAMFFKKVNFILSVSCNNEKLKLKVTF